MTKREILRLKRDGAAAFRIGGKGRNLDLAWLVTYKGSDPSYLRMAPLLRSLPRLQPNE